MGDYSLLLLRPNIITKSILHINKSMMPPLRHTFNSRELLIRQLHRLKIRFNTSRIRALRKNYISPPQPPGNQHLRQRTALTLRNPIQRSILRHPLPRGRDLVLGPQRRVGFHDDVVRLYSTALVFGRKGWISIWLTWGFIFVVSVRASRPEIRQLDTPIARALPDS